MYDVIVNDWGETTYVPNTLGRILLALILILVVAVAVHFAGKYAKSQNSGKEIQNKRLLTVKQVAFCAMAIALGTILSELKLFHFPTGGSITLLSMLIICLPGYFFGLTAGLLTGVAHGILQLIIDYFLAFGALGLSGLFCNAKQGLLKGYIVGVLGRYVFAVLSGWIFFGSYAWEGWGALPYSLVYNGIYIFSEGIITVIILAIPAVSKALARIKQAALS